MMRTGTIVTLLCLLVLGSACSSGDRAPEVAKPRAVVLITVDGMLGADLALFGGATPTPGLARLAARGAAWDDAWTAAPMTRPAVATYLTGLAPDRHRVRDDLFTGLDGGVPTLATAFAAAGYDTAAFPDSSFLGYGCGLLDGFEVAAAPPALRIGGERWVPDIRTVDAITADFDAWLDSVAAERPYFAWLHFSGPMMAQIWEATTSRITSPEVAARRVAAREEQ
ncbi:MAG TPA: sulfatase-like hydrolase/transferase, partial [Candidatus Polarisedimenticolaceae bacterium]|nr:sulfatase-like hydrolase/transferase [Candidatus Polarisedimenticolaceae bacterium]